MPRMEDLSDVQRNALLTLPVQENQSAPFRPLHRPLSRSRLALISTAGLHLRGDHPFTNGDPTYRVIPSDTGAADILQSHTSLSFDRTPALRDLNVIFPLDRVQELVERGELGGLAPSFYSFMGAQRDASRIERTSAPEVAEHLRSERVEAALLVPV
jgi:D-proline reductase (dithiol) PrdB